MECIQYLDVLISLSKIFVKIKNTFFGLKTYLNNLNFLSYRLSSPYKGHAGVGGGSSIPTPALGGRRAPGDPKGAPSTPAAGGRRAQLTNDHHHHHPSPRGGRAPTPNGVTG